MKNTQVSIKFGLIDYWRMLSKRGPLLPISYFFNVHLFDLIYKTDTHVWLPKQNYTQYPQNFDNGGFYMPSWTNEVKLSFKFLQQINLLNEEYIFIDVGCGKGKVCLLWELLARKRSHSKYSIIGIDYYEPFSKVAQENHLKLFGTPGIFINIDATHYSFSNIREQLIVYLYNPFDPIILKQVVENLPINTIIIYNNPVYIAEFAQDYEIIYQHIGWHPSAQTTILRKSKQITLCNPNNAF